MKTRLCALLFVVVAGSFAFTARAQAMTVVSCNFTRDLVIGSWGEDVRCLQSYLGGYANGYVIADGYYGPMTYQAVARWQTANGLAATGYFDAQSRAAYVRVLGGGSDVITWNTTSSQEGKALKSINDALIMIRGADEAIDDSRRNTDKAEDLLEDAKTDAINAVKAFTSGNFTKAINLAYEAYDNAEDARTRANGSSGSTNNRDREDVEDLIDDVNDRIDDAEDEIDEARDDGENVDEAEDLLEEARDTIDDAEDEFDDGDYDEAEDLAEEADELVDDALDAIGEDNNTNNDREAAEDAIDDAEDAINDAEDEIEEAEDDGEDTDESEDLLEDAQDTLDDARHEFNRGNYDEAEDLADEARDLAEDAIDELN